MSTQGPKWGWGGENGAIFFLERDKNFSLKYTIKINLKNIIEKNLQNQIGAKSLAFFPPAQGNEKRAP